MSKYKNKKGFIMAPEEVVEEKTSPIVRRKEVEFKPMDEDEAILQMELLGHDFFMYHDSETGKAAVVYRRKDKDYGLITEE